MIRDSTRRDGRPARYPCEVAVSAEGEGRTLWLLGDDQAGYDVGSDHENLTLSAKRRGTPAEDRSTTQWDWMQECVGRVLHHGAQQFVVASPAFPRDSKGACCEQRPLHILGGSWDWIHQYRQPTLGRLVMWPRWHLIAQMALSGYLVEAGQQQVSTFYGRT